MGLSTTYTKAETDYLIQNVSSIKNSKPLAITDASPTIEGWYKPTTSGTYANAGGLVAQVGYDTLFYFDGTTWSKVEVEMPLISNGIKEISIDNAFEKPLTYGYLSNDDGGIRGNGTDTNWVHTDFLLIKANSIVTYEGTETPSNVGQVCFYDANKNFIISIAGGSDSSFTATDNMIYIRVCKKTSASAAVVRFTTTEIKEVAFKEDLINLSVVNDGKNYKYDINHFLFYGQSLSQGDWESKIISNSQKYNSIMFTGGVRVWENRTPATNYNGFIPAVERSFSYLSGETVVGAEVRGETPCSGAADKIIELIKDEDGFQYYDQQYQMLISAPGMGGTGIVALSDKSGIYYQRLISDIINGKRICDEGGLTYNVPAISWIQGETDVYNSMSATVYYNNMKTLFENLNTDIKAITGQSDDIQFFLYQTQAFDWFYGGKWTYPDIPLAQLKICKDFENINMATPIYHLPHITNDCHFTAEGSKWLGGHFGVAYKRKVIDMSKQKTFINLKSYKVLGNRIYLKFDAPVYPLKFDTQNVIDRGVSKGFQIRNPNDRNQNSYLDIITDVSINKYDTVRITCNQSPIGKKLTYAINGTGSSDTSSGNLRDSQEINFYFKNDLNDSIDSNHKLYNWCPLFECILD